MATKTHRHRESISLSGFPDGGYLGQTTPNKHTTILNYTNPLSKMSEFIFPCPLGTPKELWVFPEANRSAAPSVSDDCGSSQPNSQASSTTMSAPTSNVDEWSGDITDAPPHEIPHTMQGCPPESSVLMSQIVREIRGPLRPYGIDSTGSISNLSLSSASMTTSWSQCHLSRTTAGSTEGALVRQMDKLLANSDILVHDDKLVCMGGHSVASCPELQRAGALIERLASELRGQHTELQILENAMRRKRERLDGFFADVKDKATRDPKGLVREIEDWKKAMDEWEWIEKANDRSHEVETLLDQARCWTLGG